MLANLQLNPHGGQGGTGGQTGPRGSMPSLLPSSQSGSSSAPSSSSKLKFIQAARAVAGSGSGAGAGPGFAGTVTKLIASGRGPSLVAAVEREDLVELTKCNDAFFSRLVASQDETFHSLADMMEVLSKKLTESSNVSVCASFQRFPLVPFMLIENHVIVFRTTM